MWINANSIADLQKFDDIKPSFSAFVLCDE